jgi:shikimate dehydrogenase
MHTAAIEALGLADEWSYEAIDVTPENFEARVLAMAGEGFAGANVTIPHKLAALGLASEASEAATQIGAANTLSFEGDRIRADNTDPAGVLGAMGEFPQGARALILGAGGSARAAAWGLAGAGAEVTIWNRTPGRAQDLATALGVAYAGTSPPAPDDFEILVNATPVGMDPGAETTPPTLKDLPVDADSLGARHLVVDLAYGAAETALVQTARSKGARAIDGLEVLVHQGAASLLIWTGRNPPIQIMRRAARAS